MKKAYILFILISMTVFLWSAPEEKQSLSIQFAYYPPNHQGYQANGFQLPSYSSISMPNGYSLVGMDQGRNLGNGWGGLELQLSYKQSLKYPFLQGTGMLTKNNYLEAQIITNLSPVTINLESKFIFSPVAFLKIEAGGHMGTGWHLGFNGLGLNNDGSGNAYTESFPGIVLKAWGKGTFQIDAEAFWPGEWHHIVFSTDHTLLYQNFSDAGNTDPWQYLADSGENFNGWRYESSYVLGYQMPLKVNFIGFMVEPKQNIGDVAQLSTMAEGGWGSDFIDIRMGPLMNIKTGEESSLLILLQAKNGPVYSDSSIHSNYFINRRATGATYWYWDRLAIVYSFSF